MKILQFTPSCPPTQLPPLSRRMVMVVLIVPVVVGVVVGRMMVIGGPIVGLVPGRRGIEVPTHVRAQVVVVEAGHGLDLRRVRRLNVLLEVGVVVEGHPALFTHHILGLEVHFVDVLT